jgi:hypothetical protein
MPKTLDLLAKAKAKEPHTSNAEWCRRMGVERTAINVALNRGHFAPLVAGNMARLIGEDPAKWILLAVFETAPEGAPKRALKSALTW